VAAITAIRVTGQPLGFVFAFANCALFMLYIVLGHRIANEGGPGAIDRLGAAMLIAAVVATPWGLGGALPAFGHPVLLQAGAAVRRVLVRHPLRHRPAGHGPPVPGRVLPHAGPAAGVRHRIGAIVLRSCLPSRTSRESPW